MTRLATQLDARIERAGALHAVRKLFVKIRFANFQRTTVECVGDATDLPTFLVLLEKGLARRRQPVRLLGVGVRLEEEQAASRGQFALFDTDPEERDHEEAGL